MKTILPLIAAGLVFLGCRVADFPVLAYIAGIGTFVLVGAAVSAQKEDDTPGRPRP